MSKQTAKIYSTKDYDDFSIIKGNRPVSQSHLARLTAAILENNLLAQNPIIVNAELEIIDGQHRLLIAKANNLMLYYVIADEADINDVQMLNALRKSWSAKDYLDSYALQGKRDYKRLQELYLETKMPISNLLEIFAKPGFSRWNTFKTGNFKMTEEEKGLAFLENYLDTKPLVVSDRIWGDRDFLRALQQLSGEISLDDFIKKAKRTGQLIDHRLTSKDYLRQFEEILNFRQRKNIVRLF